MDNTLTPDTLAGAIAQHALKQASDDVLLDAMVQLTHQVAALTRTLDGPYLAAAERKPLRVKQADLRAMRQEVRAELLRRLER